MKETKQENKKVEVAETKKERKQREPKPYIGHKVMCKGISNCQNIITVGIKGTQHNAELVNGRIMCEECKQKIEELKKEFGL